MKKLSLTIESGNESFDADPFAEFARLLREAADRVEHGRPDYFTLRDANGNAVGSVVISEDS